MRQGRCFICGSYGMCDAHHLFNGGLRRKADDDNLVILLCRKCHDAVHRDAVIREDLKKIGELAYINCGHTREEYMARYRKNYLTGDETIEEVTSKVRRRGNAIR